jgi:putative copper resistance protein D
VAEALIAARFVHFVAAMAAFGIGAFRIYALAGAPGPLADGARVALRRVLARALTASAVAALLTGLAMIPPVAAQMAGSAAAGFNPGTWHAVLADTAFGRAWCWHLGFAAALVALCAMPPRPWRDGAATLAALLLLASLGWVGHAATDNGGGFARVINQMTHLTAAGLWLGGLVPLGILLSRTAPPEAAGYIALARGALPHFSQAGYAAVALVALTGAVNAVLLVGSVAAFVGTPYGRLLALKIALFLVMVTLALINRFRLVPRLGDPTASPAALRALYRSVVAEQALGLGILAVVSVLGTWPPAIEAMSMPMH